MIYRNTGSSFSYLFLGRQYAYHIYCQVFICQTAERFNEGCCPDTTVESLAHHNISFFIIRKSYIRNDWFSDADTKDFLCFLCTGCSYVNRHIFYGKWCRSAFFCCGHKMHRLIGNNARNIFSVFISHTYLGRWQCRWGKSS